MPLPRSQRLIEDSKLLTDKASLLELAIANEIDEVVVAADDRRRKLPVGELLDCKMSGFAVLDLLKLFREGIRCGQDRPAVSELDIVFSKRVPDGCVWPLWQAIIGFGVGIADVGRSLAVDVGGRSRKSGESRGRDPVLYQQIRIGQDGMPFRVYKFRSMRVDAEADGCPRWAVKNDKRITPLVNYRARAWTSCRSCSMS